MFTLKFFDAVQDKSFVSYRCIAAAEFTVQLAKNEDVPEGAEPLPLGCVLVDWIPVGTNSHCNRVLYRGEYCIVENAAGKTIDRIRFNPEVGHASH